MNPFAFYFLRFQARALVTYHQPPLLATAGVRNQVPLVLKHPTNSAGHVMFPRLAALSWRRDIPPWWCCQAPRARSSPQGQWQAPGLQPQVLSAAFGGASRETPDALVCFVFVGRVLGGQDGEGPTEKHEQSCIPLATGGSPAAERPSTAASRRQNTWCKYHLREVSLRWCHGGGMRHPRRDLAGAYCTKCQDGPEPGAAAQ